MEQLICYKARNLISHWLLQMLSIFDVIFSMRRDDLRGTDLAYNLSGFPADVAGTKQSTT
jgi:hypothetical protein